MPATCPPPPFEQIALEDGLSAYSALVNGTTDYWLQALERTATPWDLARDWQTWLRIVTDRKRPTWSTPHEVVWEADVARLRDFSTAGPRSKVVPTLVLPPQAGHDSCIVDYSPRQSQMGAIREAGLSRAFTLDWVGATDATKDATIDDYLEVIDRAVAHAGGRVNLVGDCQGGWLATIYAALAPERVHTLTIAGAPIDFHCGEPVVHSVVDALAPGGDLAFYRHRVAMNGGVLRGEDM